MPEVSLELRSYVAEAARVAGLELSPERVRIVAAALYPLLTTIQGIAADDETAEAPFSFDPRWQ